MSRFPDGVGPCHPFDIPAAGAAGFAPLRDNATGQYGLYSIDLATGAATLKGKLSDGVTPVTSIAIVPEPTRVAGQGPGASGSFVVGKPNESFLRYPQQQPFPGFSGAIRVAAGDVNGDGTPDIIAAAGPGGGPHVKVFSGPAGNQEIRSFMAFDPSFLGGVTVASGDVNGDGFKDIIAAADANGGPHVRVFSGNTGALLTEFFAYDPSFTGGVRVASADFDNDGKWEIVTAAGVGGGPHVRVFGGTAAPFSSHALPAFVNNFFAYEPSFTGGVNVAAGDITADGIPEIIAAAGPGGGPHVKVFSGVNAATVSSFFAYEPFVTAGVNVGVSDINRDGLFEIQAALASLRADNPTPAFDDATAFDRHGKTVQSILTFEYGIHGNIQAPNANGNYVAGARA